MALAEIRAPVDARVRHAEAPDVEPLAAEVLRRADELQVVVEGHAAGEAFGRHGTPTFRAEIRDVV